MAEALFCLWIGAQFGLCGARRRTHQSSRRMKCESVGYNGQILYLGGILSLIAILYFLRLFTKAMVAWMKSPNSRAARADHIFL